PTNSQLRHDSNPSLSHARFRRAAIFIVTLLSLAFCARPVQLFAQDTELEGTLEVLHEDRSDGSRYHYILHSKSGRQSLHFTKPPTHLLTGSKIRVKGVQAGNTLALGGESTSVQQIASAPVPTIVGGQRTLVILVNFQDNPVEPYTVADARHVVFDTTSNFFLENSYQQAWLVGDVVGWYTVPVASTNCDSSAIESYAKQAAT